MRRTQTIPRFVAGLLFVCWISAGALFAQETDAPPKPFTLVVLPDTQCYCDTQFAQSAKRWGNGDLRKYLFAQTDWIRRSAKELNIAFTVHEGDINQTNYPEEWAIAREAMKSLDGIVPYCFCLGNHDMGVVKSETSKSGYVSGVDRTTLFNDYFPRAKFAKWKSFGGTFDESHDNSYYHFEQSGMKFLILNREFVPRDEVLEWAGKITQKHADHRVMIVTHNYLEANNTRIKGNHYKVQGNDGEQMWEKFVSKHENIFLVLCGHRLGEGYLLSKGVAGNPVHQLLADYQGENNGGEGWLRYMTFHPTKDTIEVHTYNPVFDKQREGESSRFTLSYEMLKETQAVER